MECKKIPFFQLGQKGKKKISCSVAFLQQKKILAQMKSKILAGFSEEFKPASINITAQTYELVQLMSANMRWIGILGFNQSFCKGMISHLSFLQNQ